MQRLWNWARILSSGAPAPGCTVTVYAAGTVTLSTIFSDNISTPKANPFTADASTGYWFFYALQGRYDIKFSGTGITSPYTLSDVTLFDPTDGFIQSLNGQAQAVQTLVAGTAGTDFVVNSAAGVHTLNLPNAGAASRGVVSTGAQTFAGVKTFSTPIAAGSGGTGADLSAAGNGKLLIGNGTGFTLANLASGGNAGVTITNGVGSITLDTPQDIRTNASPVFLSLEIQALNQSPTGGALFVSPGDGVLNVRTLNDGEILVGATGFAPQATFLHVGSGLSLINGPWTITLANTGILSLASSAGAALTGALTLAVGSAGTDVAISPTVIGATTVTLNVPDASASARGVINSTTQVIGGVKTFNSPPLVIPGGASSSTTPGRPVVSFLRNLTPVGNVGTGEDDLQTVSLPANSLDTDFASALRITSWGTVAANANTKTIKLYFGSTLLCTIASATALNDGAWYFEATVIRTGAGNQEVIAEGRAKAVGATAAAYTITAITQSNPAQALGSAVTIKTTGEAVSNSDIIAKALLVEVLY